jgi:hypothetical protein
MIPLLMSAIGRAEAMAYRDAWGQAITDPDWSETEGRLRRAYQVLKAGLANGDEWCAGLRAQKSPGRCRGS